MTKTTQRTTPRQTLTQTVLHALRLVVFLLGLSALAAPSVAQCSNCGQINPGQPKLWSLADAQYLVGQARDNLKALRVALPNETTITAGMINPNAVNMRELDILLESIGIKGQFDQDAALENQQARQKYETEQATFKKHEEERDRLDKLIKEKQVSKAALDEQVAGKEKQVGLFDAEFKRIDDELVGLRAERTKLIPNPPPSPNPNQEEIDRLTKNIGKLDDERADFQRDRRQEAIALAGLRADRNKVNGELTALTAQKDAVPTITVQALSTTATGVPSETVTPAGGALLTQLFNEPEVRNALQARLKTILLEDPTPPYIIQLNNVVDGFLQTISHRLTLLRQSVDPNYDLYFMEASTSLAPGKNAKHHIASARWTISPAADMDWVAFASQYFSDAFDDTTFDKLVVLGRAKGLTRRGAEPLALLLTQSETNPQNPRTPQQQDEALLLATVAHGCDAVAALSAENAQNAKETLKDMQTLCTLPTIEPGRHEVPALVALGLVASYGGIHKRLSVMPWITPYVFELSPTQGAINIARTETRSKRWSFLGVLKTLAGFGLGAGYDRQRDIYRQLLQPEVFIAGQGKGSRTEFGWDYAPLPGAQLVDAGSITSYGVLAIPSFRRSVTFGTKWDWIKKPEEGGTPPPKLTTHATTYTVNLPGQADFWIDALEYDGVPMGEEISVILRGKGFSQETTILVNNIPLEPRWRLIDATTSDVSYAATPTTGAVKIENGQGTRKTHGAFELLSATTIGMRFRLPDFAGMPQITILSPHRSVQLNDLPIQVNRQQPPPRVFGQNREGTMAVIQREFLAGRSKDNVMFLPIGTWPSMLPPEFLFIDELRHTVDVRLRLRGVPMSDGKTPAVYAVIQTRSGPTKWDVVQPLSMTERKPAEGLLSLQGVETMEGDLHVQIMQLPPTASEAAFQVRIPVPYRPRIVSLAPPQARADEETELTINGDNLLYADKVFVGAADAPILSRTDKMLRVRVPKGTADTKATVRIVSSLKRDDKEVASSDTSVFTYQAPPTAPKATLLKVIDPPEDPGAETAMIERTIEADLTGKPGTPTFTAYNGTTWAAVNAARHEGTNRFGMTLPTYRGKVMLRLLLTKDGTTSLVDEQTIDVKFAPSLTQKTYTGGVPGQILAIEGKNLHHTTKVHIGTARDLEPINVSYDRVTVIIPAGTATVSVVVQAGVRSTEAGALTYR